MDDETFQVVDERDFGVFFMPDKFVDKMLRLIGSNGLRVYTIMRRHNGENDEGQVSHKELAKLSGVSEGSIKRGVKILKERRLIEVIKERDENGKFLYNRYIFLKESVWDCSEK